MDFSDSQGPSRNTIIGIGAVILLHVFLVYALISGLATSAVEMIKKPLEIKIIQQTTPPPPPPPPVTLPPPPLLAAPPPPYVPPPIIQVQAPPQQVFAVTSAKPSAPQSTAPQTPNTSVGVVCPNVVAVAKKLSAAFQDIADTSGVNSAEVVVQFTVGASGQVSNPSIVSSNFQGVNNLALAGVAALSCKGQGQDVQVRAPFEFEAN
ncbi:MAG: hypothetical protein B7Z75_11725 [Acidocella sp. 20-57-95]|nr:MAG: hypothetical protein B7Z75_11725 [Acidocella sp. 20-57-95]HQT63130.1 energy transducer TonB [Acidocella sp.]HQU05303.1 energy transducer TonB [Acidocella sp.]